MSGTASTIRQPRFQFQVGGQVIAGVKDMEVQTNSYRRAASFRATIATSASPSVYAQVTAMDGNNLPLMAELLASLDNGQTLTSLLFGRIDRFSWDPITGTMRIEGRDRTADLIEARTFAAYKNQTASEVVQTIGAALGFTVQATPTKTPVGRYYQTDHDKITAGQFTRSVSDWELLCSLARDEGYDVWVSGNTLYFQPYPAITQTPGFTVQFTPSNGAYKALNVLSCVPERDLILARDVQVDVHSWNSKKKSGFTVSYRAVGAKSANIQTASNQVGQNTQRYPVTIPNLTQNQALQKAQQIARDITTQERRATVRMPGELVLTPQSIVAIAGTGTDFDQAYFVGEISRRISTDEGFVQTLQLKTTSPRTADIVNGPG